jgi:heparan-alpha-glucosaminide N-acetyltransferase
VTGVSGPLAPVAPPRTGSRRVTSLDVVRGLMLCVSVGVNSLLVTPGWFEHAEWDGVHGLDLVFPVFVTLTGCGLGFAMHRRTNLRSLGRRVLVLVAAGLLYNALVLDSWDPATWRFTGVLQLYAGVVVVLVLGHLLTRTARGWFVITTVLALGWATALAWFATTCAGGVLTRECNPSGVVDVAVFTAPHVYWGGDAGHDPEGLLSTLGACLSAAAGACVGHAVLSRTAPRDCVRPVLTIVAGFLLLAAATRWVPELLTGEPVQVMKRLWTPPFALLVAAGVALALLLGHLVLDRSSAPVGLRRAVWPLEALGRNSLLVYFGSHVLTAVLARQVDADGVSLAQRIADAVALGGHPQIGLTLLALLFWGALAALLHQRRIYLRP